MAQRHIVILGGDGYLGWPMAMHLSAAGYAVTVADNYLKRTLFEKLGLRPLYEVPDLEERARIWRRVSGRRIDTAVGDAGDRDWLVALLEHRPADAVVHFGEIPSAPYSMMDAASAWQTIENNLRATLSVMWAIRETDPDTHLVKLGTMGEYGTPNIDIEEGFIEVGTNGRRDRLPFPKMPGSFYHLSKVQDSDMLYLGVRLWKLRVTDLNQGPVYGLETAETRLEDCGRLRPHFHYDEFWGTVLNRFLVQAAAEIPLTVYGRGGQQRGFLHLADTLQCVRLALENPAQPGEFRVMNQFTEIFSIRDLAQRVRTAASTLGLAVSIEHVPNPRREAENHYYNAKNTRLIDLGLRPHLLTDEMLADMIRVVRQNAGRIDNDIIMPGRVQWA